MPWKRKWQPTPVFFPGEIPWTEGPGGLQSMGLQRVAYDLAHTNPLIMVVISLEKIPFTCEHFEFFSAVTSFNFNLTSLSLITSVQRHHISFITSILN